MTRKKLPNRRKRTPVEFELRGHKFYGGFGHYDGGEVGEVFLGSGKTGQLMSIIASDSAVAASLAIQYGCPIDVLQKAFLREEDGTAAGPLGALFDMMGEDAKKP